MHPVAFLAVAFHVSAVPLTEPSEQGASGSSTWTAGVFVDTGYVYNSNHPDNHVYRAAVTTPRTGEFTVNLGAAYVVHAATKEEPWHLSFALQAGPAADALYATEPEPGGEASRFAGPEVWKHIGMATAGGMVPRSETEIQLGLMGSPIGIGGFWSKDDWNVSPTWAANGTPYYLLGARVVQPLPAGFGVEAWLVNGWQTAADVNDVPSYVAAVTWTYRAWSAAQVVMFGPEQELHDPEYWQFHSDSKLTWDRPRIGVAALWDVGRAKWRTPGEEGALPSEEVALWTGGALFVRGRPYDGRSVDVEAAIRGDAWWDRDGRIYGIEGWLVGATATLGVNLWDHLLVRVEYRYDHTTDERGFFYRHAAVTDDALGLAQDQHNVFLSVVGMVERGFPSWWRR